MVVRPATSDDAAAIHTVVTAAFGQPDEADLVDALRADGDAVLELVAEDDGRIIGHILFSPLATDTGDSFVALAPLSVTPGEQRGGIGTWLMETAHELLRGQGIQASVVLGHPDYYPRVGYSAEAAKSVTAPFEGPHFMALELQPGALATPVKVTYAKAFGIPEAA